MFCGLPTICPSRAFRYSNNPYAIERTAFVEYAPLPTVEHLPAGTVHECLHGYVSFYPFPRWVADAKDVMSVPAAALVADAAATAAPVTAAAAAEGEMMPQQRIFIGQLPYNTTAAQVLFLCELFGGKGCAYPQRIMKMTPKGDRLPTGGVHVYCDEACYKTLEQNVHKRVLVDDSGVWFAATEGEKAALDDYCTFLHDHRESRPAGRPYSSVVVQRATSLFVPQRNRGF